MHYDTTHYIINKYITQIKTKKMNNHKYIQPVNILLTITITTLISCSSNNKKSDAYGNFEATEIIVASELTGKVIDLQFDEGSTVKEGQMMLLIDTIPLFLQYEQLKASKQSVEAGLQKVYTAIQVQKAQKQVIETDLNRIKKLIKENAATQKQLDDAEGQLNITNKQIDNTSSQLASIQAELNVMDTKIATLADQIKRCKICAPTSGTVLTLLTEKGELLTPGKPVFKMANLDGMYLRAYVSGDMLPSIKIGQNVTVYIDQDKSSNQSLQGTITWISSSAEFTPKIIQTKKERVDQVYAIKVKVNNDGRVKIGMPGEVVFNTNQQ
jgi:HlyD family secretion protein